MKATKIKTQTRWAAGLAAITMMAGFTSPLYADHAERREYVPIINAANPQFRSNHPLKVYVKVGIGRREDGHQQAAHTFNKMQHLLPTYIALTDNRAAADLVIKVQQTDYTLNYRIIDTDNKDKKYKKDRRKTGRKCGYYQKAYYTKVKEKGEAYASYNVKTNLKGFGREYDQVTLRSAENFSYGANLRASTNCGIRQTNHMPSNGVAKLFRQAEPEYRHHVSYKIRQEAAETLGLHLARTIGAKSNDFYVGLAARLNVKSGTTPASYYGGYYDGYYGDYDTEHREDYDFRNSRHRNYRHFPRYFGGNRR